MILGPVTACSSVPLFSRAATELGVPTTQLDISGAGPNVNVQRVYQRVWRARPYRLNKFSAHVVTVARSQQVDVILALGNAPLTTSALQQLARDGVKVINFSSDDPWNAANRSRWRIATLPHYAAVFTPRTANLAELRAAGCSHVAWVPFAYDPTLHRRATPEESAAEQRTADVVFIGGCDSDRIPYLKAVCKSRSSVALYGGYWDRNPTLRRFHAGRLMPDEMPAILARAKVSICLVRRANRDGHVMRTYEEPAMGSCVAMEDTPDHRALFPDPAAEPCFFRTPNELAACVNRLCDEDDLRQAVAATQHDAVVGAANRYSDRLRDMLHQTAALPEPS